MITVLVTLPQHEFTEGHHKAVGEYSETFCDLFTTMHAVFKMLHMWNTMLPDVFKLTFMVMAETIRMSCC